MGNIHQLCDLSEARVLAGEAPNQQAMRGIAFDSPAETQEREDGFKKGWNSLVKVALAQTPIGRVLGHVPLIEKAYTYHALRRTNYAGLFAGVYESYAAALRRIPASRNRGWDNQESAQIWLSKIDHMQPAAYAPFFWLWKVLREGSTIVDYGGSIGLSYYSYTARRPLPPSVRWIVVEVPHLVSAGKQVARREAATQLYFESDLRAVPPCDILFSAGALQYVEESVAGVLEKLSTRPTHILINKLPLTTGRGYWTLQNFGTAVSPYRVYNEREFLGYFEAAGYFLRDRWSVSELSCSVPFHPECFVPTFSGFHFEMRSQLGAPGVIVNRVVPPA